MRIALCGIVKDEAPYLLDWIAWHRALGVTDFIIADNESTDGTREMLQELMRAGVVTTFDVERRFHSLPQIIAYGHMARMAARLGFAWAAFFDADEFLMPAGPDQLLADCLAAMPADCGAVAINWALFGSSGQHRAQADPVPFRFEQRFPAEVDGGKNVNRHYKTVLRVGAMDAAFANPHDAKLKAGYRRYRADGAAMQMDKPGLSQDVLWVPFRLNHYIVKSWGEYLQNKVARGTFNKNPKLSLDFFERHRTSDADEHDPLPAWAKPAFAQKRQALDALLDDTSHHDKAVARMLAYDPPLLDAHPTIDAIGDVSPRAPLWRRRLRRAAMWFGLLGLRPQPPLDW